MSIAVLVQVHEEVRRLAIAGSAVAGGDFRLKKLVMPLEQAGAKAPVFGRVAQAAQAVVDSNEKTASAALLELAMLTNAILHTQGETGIAGDIQALATVDLSTGNTQTSARVLKPLLEALRSTGSGRIELVRDALERGMFRDLRLVRPTLYALDDPYPELAGLIADKVLPQYGHAIVPELRTALDITGRGGNLHRLRLLHALDPEGTRDLVHRALEEGSKEIRIAAIECLGTTGSDLGYLLEHAKARAKDVRAAALRALSAAAASSAEIVDVLKRAIDGTDIELLTDQLKQSAVPEIRDHLLAQADRQLTETLATKDPKQQGPAIERLQNLVFSLEGRADTKTDAFLLRCFESTPALAKIKSTPSGQDFNEVLATVLARGTPKLRQLLAAAHKSLTGGMLPPAFDAARETMTPADFYKEFSPLLAALATKGGKKGTEQERAAALMGVLLSRHEWRFGGSWIRFTETDPDKDAPKRELDPRWLDAALDSGSLELVCRLARPGHPKASTFLSGQIGKGKPHEEYLVLETMVRIKHPGAAEGIIDALRKEARTPRSGYFMYWHNRLIAGLPSSDFPKFDALMPTLPDKMVDQLLESVTALKNKTE